VVLKLFSTTHKCFTWTHKVSSLTRGTLPYPRDPMGTITYPRITQVAQEISPRYSNIFKGSLEKNQSTKAKVNPKIPNMLYLMSHDMNVTALKKSRVKEREQRRIGERKCVIVLRFITTNIINNLRKRAVYHSYFV